MSFFLNPALACDYYKTGHLWMQPKGMQMVYSTWTARSNRHHPDCPNTVVFGYQYTIRQLIEFFDDNFFHVPVETLRKEYEEVISASFNDNYSSFEKFEALHKLGHLPLAIYGVPEGTLLPVGIPSHVMWNTDSNFAWLPQFIEDMWSSANWLPSTSATTAYYRKKLIEPTAEATSDVPNLAAHMCGDFSLRGHTSIEAGLISGAGHLLSFDRTATIGANLLLKKYYAADGEVPGMGTPSLEHSVVEQGVAWFKHKIAEGSLPEYMMPYINKAMMDGTWEVNLVAEMCFILHLITTVQPTGMMTYVADTYDYWGVVKKVLPTIKDAIMARDGCFSLRPDSGDPIEIIETTLPELLKTFGCTVNSKGCRVLPRQIRMIYGDAITAEITKEVCHWCVGQEISLENLAFGIGAFTYQYVTRDTRGFAIKATDCIHDEFGELPIFKAPKTDPGKKSPRGAVAVLKDCRGCYCMVDQLTVRDAVNFPGNVMVKLMENGEMFNQEDFYTIRKRLEAEVDADTF